MLLHAAGLLSHPLGKCVIFTSSLPVIVIMSRGILLHRMVRVRRGMLLLSPRPASTSAAGMMLRNRSASRGHGRRRGPAAMMISFLIPKHFTIFFLLILIITIGLARLPRAAWIIIII